MWAPWLAASVAAECLPQTIDIDVALSDFDLPVEGWHASIAEILSTRAYMFEEEWPPADRELVAWLRMRPGLRADPDLRVSGLVLVRASDESICLTLGEGRVAESWGGGLAVNHYPAPDRYARAYAMPYVVYLRGSRRGSTV